MDQAVLLDPAKPPLLDSARPPLALGARRDTAVDEPGARDAARQFEAFVLQSFVDAMLPRESGAFGRGIAGYIWKSMLAEQIATELARSGGVGIARLITPAIRAGEVSSGPGG